MDFVSSVLSIAEEYAIDVHWHVDKNSGVISFWVGCSDLFYSGAHDSETITPDNVKLLRDTAKEVEGLELSSQWVPSLFSARIRGMRPQGAIYKRIPCKLWKLFDACGPWRELNFGNPKYHPDDELGDN